MTVATPKRRIVATALRQPLEVTHHNLDFSLPSGFLNLLGAINGPTAHCHKKTLLINNSAKVLNWTLDTKSCGSAVEEGIFQFVTVEGAYLPFLREGATDDTDTLQPGETFSLDVRFCPSKSVFNGSMMDDEDNVTLL